MPCYLRTSSPCSKQILPVHVNVPLSEAVDAGHTPGVGEDSMLEMKQCSSQDFSPTKQDINPAGRLVGGGGGGGEEGEMYGWRLTGHFHRARDQPKQFLFIQDFSIVSIKMNCLCWLHYQRKSMPSFKEHATIAKRQKSRKMREVSYECTIHLWANIWGFQFMTLETTSKKWMRLSQFTRKTPANRQA